MTQNTQEFYSRRQLATAFGVHYITVLNWEKAGKLTPYRVGPASIRYKREDVERLIEAAGKRA